MRLNLENFRSGRDYRIKERIVLFLTDKDTEVQRHLAGSVGRAGDS